MTTQTIYNYRKADDLLITGGQPTEEQIRSAAVEGFGVVINLAIPDPRLPDEAALVRSLGMTYVHIPVEWENPTEADFAAFEAAMQARPPGATLLHCYANYRATAFYSLYAQKHLGWTGEQAQAFRASIWQGSDYPIWEEFIRRMRAKISLPTQPDRS
jgi:protein tyrosine phosphatase (PTP) superfamily phosphohydrolase (DUF442 family)